MNVKCTELNMKALISQVDQILGNAVKALVGQVDRILGSTL